MKAGSAIFHESRHLDDKQLLSPNPECIFCGSEERLTICVMQKNPEVSLQKCVNCGAASASRLPTKEALDEYYEDYYRSSCFAAHTQRITFDNAERFGRHLAYRLANYANASSMKILDFGGGDGSIALRTAQQLLRRGCASAHITVVDYNNALAETDDARIALVRQDILEGLSPQGFDLVIASAVIEHVPEPLAVLLALLNLLGRGGIFYARTPYVVPLIRLFKLLGMEWHFTFPAHIHDLGRDFWEAFFGKVISSDHFSLLESRPAIVETSFKDHFLRTLVAYTFKAPWYLLRKHYTLVGGWEVFVRRESDAIIDADIKRSVR